jgi:hypothetical protein
MPKKTPGLSLDPKGDDFILRRTSTNGKTVSVTLSNDDIITLAQSIPSLRDRILAGHNLTRGAISAVVMTEVTQVVLNTDLHRSEIHLTMIDRHGAQVGFALPLKIARPLVDRLPVRVAQIEAAAKSRIRQ